MTHTPFKATAAAALLALSAVFNAPAFASGSDGGGSAETGAAQAYNMGKGVYAQKLACKACPLAGKSLDAAMASGLLKSTESFSLSTEEQAALATYLKLRFKL